MKNTNNLCTPYLKVILLLAVFILPFSLSAIDFGLVANVYSAYGDMGAGGVEAEDDENTLEFKADILPRLSFLIGDSAEFFISAGLSLGVSSEADEEFYYVPELLRTEFNMRFGNYGIKAGRMNYSDPLSFITVGLFDGFQFNLNSDIGKFSIGSWYTGLLYKKNADITMTDNDLTIYSDADTYFAPKRMIAAFEWDHPSIAEILRLNAAVIGQVDLADSDQYHNQYLILKAGVPVKSFLFELGGGVEFSQSNDEFNIGLAGDFGVSWMLPTNIVSRLSLNCKIAGGEVEDSLKAFTPITTRYFGNIYKQKMTGLSIVSLDYSARLGETVGLNVSGIYFVRNDLAFNSYPVNSDIEDDGYFLGPEIFARVVWSPLSDIQFNLGGGAFLPILGNVGSDEKPQWRVELTAILALY